MSPQEESRLISAITIVESKVDGINVRLDRLNGQVVKSQENIARHDNQFVSVLTHIASFDQNAQDIKMMNLPRFIERVEWHNKIIWAVLGTSIAAFIAALFTLVFK